MKELTEIFTELLRISLLGSGMIIIVALLHILLGKKLPGKVAYGLWMIVLIRLLFLVQIPSVVSVENQFPKVFEVFEDKVVETNTNESDIITYGSLHKEIFAPQTRFDKAVEVLTYIWIFGIFVVMFFPVVSYVTLKRAIEEDETATSIQYGSIEHKARRMVGVGKISIKYSYYLDAPALIGVFRPIIVLPASMKAIDEETLLHILLHEYVHYKHFHLWIQWAFWFVKAIHWFNPLVWIAHEWIKLDAEFACDDEVIRILGEENKNRYGHILIEVASDCEKSPYAMNAAGLIHQDKELRKRIARIGRAKRDSKVLSVITITVILVMIPIFFTVQMTATEEIKELFVQRKVDVEPQDKYGMLIDITSYSFDSTTGELKVHIEYSLNETMQQYLEKVSECNLCFYLSFPKSYNYDIRTQNIIEYVHLSQQDNENGKGNIAYGEEEIIFKIEDYDAKKYGDPVLFYTGSEMNVAVDTVLHIDENSVGEVYQIDDIVALKVKNVNLGESKEALIEYEISYPNEFTHLFLYDEISITNKKEEVISTKSISSHQKNSSIVYKVKAVNDTETISKMTIDIRRYGMEMGDIYPSIFQENKKAIRWNLSLVEE